MKRSFWAAVALGSTVLTSGVNAETFRFAYTIDTSSLDPYALAETFTLAYLGNMYEPLVARDKDLSLMPALAESWEVVEPTVWRFHLREGVTFHNGEPFTADDVVFSIERVRGPNSDIRHNWGSVVDVRKVDDFTVDIITAQPNPILPNQITSTYMMSRTWAEENGAVEATSVRTGTENFATTNLNGTGPFMIRERRADERTVLVPHPDWWGEPEHNLTEVIFTPIESAATRVAALLSGELDMIYPVPVQDVPRLEGADGIVSLQGPEMRTLFLNMDQARDELLDSNIEGANPLQDRRVREAIYRAIDIEAIRDRVMGGASTPAGLLVAPALTGFREDLNDRLPFDPELSRELLAQAGYPDGFSMGMDCPNDRYVNDEAICLAVVGMLARVGIDIDLLAQTRSRYFEKILSRDSSFSLLAWMPLTFDSHSTLFSIIHTPTETAGSYNVGGYSNPEVDEIIAQVEFEIDLDRRNELIGEAFRIHKEDIGHIPLHQQALSWGARENVSLVQRGDDSMMLKWVRIEN